MPPSTTQSFLDTAVKLAGLGASGVCIFSVLCILWILLRGGGVRDEGERRLITWYMLMCVIMTTIIAGTSIISARMNSTSAEDALRRMEVEKSKSQKISRQLEEYKHWHDEVAKKNDDFRKQISELKMPKILGGGKITEAPGIGPSVKILLDKTYVAPIPEPTPP